MIDTRRKLYAAAAPIMAKRDRLARDILPTSGELAALERKQAEAAAGKTECDKALAWIDRELAKLGAR